ncbi:MAG: LDL receptor domain-containing protein [Myxococcota bacterium]|nr:LDL receptor domain-containing protein [Myxococcota bacterium]
MKWFSSLLVVMALYAVPGCSAGEGSGEPTAFVCEHDQSVIAAALRCDGSFDCYDASDEKGCEYELASNENTKTDTPDECGFDPARVGTSVGDHVADFTVKDEDDDDFSLHSLCGSGKTAIWIILAAQW